MANRLKARSFRRPQQPEAIEPGTSGLPTWPAFCNKISHLP
jgi:hypothetical protein